jgi:chloramphenicol 3-O phosphotransferase
VTVAAPRPGQVIFLNGTSSSGKSSIAEQLLLVLERPFFHMSIDAVNAMRARERTLELDPGSEQWRLLDCLTVLSGLDIIFVGVRCPEQELARREKARGDRQPGQAATQLRQVHSYGSYDIECDTSTASPRDCALAIKQSLNRLPHPRAFDRLRSTLLD